MSDLPSNYDSWKTWLPADSDDHVDNPCKRCLNCACSECLENKEPEACKCKEPDPTDTEYFENPFEREDC